MDEIRIGGSKMAKKTHLTIIRKGVEHWNDWRSEHPDVLPDLSGADLKAAKLSGVNLDRANLKGVKFTNAYLSRAEITFADLTKADLEKSNLFKAQLWRSNLSKANLNETLIFHQQL